MKAADLRAWLAERNLLTPVLDAVSVRHATLDEIFAPGRTARIVAGRRAAWTALFDAGCSYVEIARLWGVDHTTVCYGCNEHSRRTNREVAA